MTDQRQHIPAVDRLLASDPFAPLLAEHPRDRVVRHLRTALDVVRERIARGDAAEASAEVLAADVGEAFRQDDVASLRRVINATGVVLHTNLGRAPLADAARDAMARTARGYTNLEFDLESGKRGSRYTHCVDLLCELTGAEAALVVNNAAAALVLGMNTLSLGTDVLVSRGELVEIGGGFRIPEILSRSGANLHEVGSTNRTRIGDYEEALDSGGVTSLLKVHRSNFRISGFTEQASVRELAELAARADLHLFHDLGSGLMIDPALVGLPVEPRPADSLAEGAHVVAFSGDKLLGGPQAGILLGSEALIALMRRNPLCRALRVDKVTLAGLEATLRLYRDPERAIREIPTLRMIAAAPEVLHERADRLVAVLEERGVPAKAVLGESVVGGGTYPGAKLQTYVLEIGPEAGPAKSLADRLRAGDPPVIARVDDDRLVLDVRTITPEEEGELADRLVLVAAGA